MIHMLTGAQAYRPAYSLVYLPVGLVPLVGVDPLLLSRVGPCRPVVGGMPRRSQTAGTGRPYGSFRPARAHTSRTGTGPGGTVANANAFTARRSGTADADLSSTVSCALALSFVRPDDAEE